MFKILRCFIGLVLISEIVFADDISKPITRLPSISGISSGGFMAIQMATIYSSEFSGVGSFAGGFYYCAQNYLQEKIQEGQNSFLGLRNLFLFKQSDDFYRAIFNPIAFLKADQARWVMPSQFNPIYMSVGICMRNPEYSILPDLNSAEKSSIINNLQNFKNLRAYIYHGMSDTVVYPQMAQQLEKFYIQNGLSKENIKISSSEGAHNFPTDKSNLNDCNSQKIPFVSSCQLNGAKEVLEHLLNKNLEKNIFNKNNLYVIDQSLNSMNLEASEDKWKSPAASLAAYGYLYSSQYCLDNPDACIVHVALHGCEMSDSYDQDFDELYNEQVKNKFLLNMRNKSQVLNDIIDTPYIEQRNLKYGLLKFVLQSGYAEYAEKNNLIILFPQTWISQENYPLNPKGCWDWFGSTGSEYATSKGLETSWLMNYIKNVSRNPKSFIFNQRPHFSELK